MTTPTPTRRGLLGAAIWTPPAIATAVAAPAYATSTTPGPSAPPLITAECAPAPGRKKVRLTVRLTPRPHRAVVLIGGLLARYDEHHGYYVDVHPPTWPLLVTVTWVDNKGKPRATVVTRDFACAPTKAPRA